MGTRVAKAALPKKQDMLLRFVAEIDHISRARAVTAEALTEWGMAGLIDDASLVVSELLANGLVASGEMVIMKIAREQNGILVGVWDSSPRMPEMKHPGGHTEKGRGLHIVAALSSERGYCRADAGGKVVWARLTIGTGHSDRLGADPISAGHSLDP